MKTGARGMVKEDNGDGLPTAPDTMSPRLGIPTLSGASVHCV